MTVSISAVTFDTADAKTLSRWWATQTGGTIVQENDGWFVVVSLPDSPIMLSFQQVDDPTPGKNRIHVDLLSDDVEADTDRLVAAGASLLERHEMGGFGWNRLADPEGNQFCIALAHSA